MSILDAKVINTVRGLEVYVDSVDNIEIKELHIPTLDSPFYEIWFGIEYFLLRENKYYDSHVNYFSIRMDDDFSFIILKETETESLFAVKSEAEREATKNLLGEWFIKTNAYKECVKESIKKVKEEDIYTAADIHHSMQSLKFLERLLEVTTEDIRNAAVEKPVQFAMI